KWGASEIHPRPAPRDDDAAGVGERRGMRQAAPDEQPEQRDQQADARIKGAVRRPGAPPGYGNSAKGRRAAAEDERLAGSRHVSLVVVPALAAQRPRQRRGPPAVRAQLVTG